jgi:hypothetical protein
VKNGLREPRSEAIRIAREERREMREIERGEGSGMERRGQKGDETKRVYAIHLLRNKLKRVYCLNFEICSRILS